MERKLRAGSLRHSSRRLRASSRPAGPGYTPLGGNERTARARELRSPAPSSAAAAKFTYAITTAAAACAVTTAFITHPVVPAARDGAVPSRVPGAARRHHRPPDRGRARRLPAPLHGAGGHATSRSPRVHGARYIDEIEAASPEEGLHFIDPDTALNPHTLDAARHAAGAAVLARRPRHARRMPHRVLRGAPAGPPCRAQSRDGLLHLQQRRDRRRARAGRARPRARRDRRLRRASRQRHRGHLQRRPARADGVDVPASALSVFAASTIPRRTWSTFRCRGQRRRGVSRRGARPLAAGARSASAAADPDLRRIRRASRGSARRAASSSRPTTRGSRAS